MFCWFKSLRSTQIVMLRTVLTGSWKIQYRLLTLGSRSLQERTREPPAAAVLAGARCASVPPKFPPPQAAGWVLGHPCQTDGWLLGGEDLPSRCFQCSLQSSDSLTGKTATWAAKRAPEHLGRWPNGPAELLSVRIILGRWHGGCVKSIFPIDQKTPKHRQAHFYSY